MKPFLYITAIFLLFSINAFALDASVKYATFHAAQQDYIEVYLHFTGQTVGFVTLENQKLQANVEVIIVFKQDGHIIKFDKYALNSPEADAPLNFFDQKRYALAKGNYLMEVSLKDLNKVENARTYTAEVAVNYDENKICQSDIQLLQTYRKDSSGGIFTKNGYYMEALPFDFYDKHATHLAFYNEIYNTDQSGNPEVYISYLVDKVMGNGSTEPVMAQHKKRVSGAVIPILTQLDIQQLPSGNYRLNIECRNDKKELLSLKSVSFQRSNPFLNVARESLSTDALAGEFVAELDEAALRYAIKAIAFKVPEADIAVINMILQENDLMAQRRFLFNYWAGQSPNLPQYAYLRYMEVAKAVDKMYDNGFGYGFETDRGRVYMKYGRPDDIVTSENEPSAPPYEIWIYYDFPATKQSNVKFIFYNPSLVANGHVMLHSTARGEINNPRWQVELYRDAPNDMQGNSMDATEVSPGINRNAERLFNDN